MSSNQSSYNYVGTNFVIENNIVKGLKEDVDSSTKSVGEIILNHLKNHPNEIGQIDAGTGNHTTMSEMRENMIRCAIWLRKQGLNKDDVIVVCTHNQIDAYIPCFATFLIGAVYNPWYYKMSITNLEFETTSRVTVVRVAWDPEVARYHMNLVKPKIIFVCESALKTLVEAAKLENLDSQFVVFGKDSEILSIKDLIKFQTPVEVETFQPELVKDLQSISMIFFSSGTTGLPKGVAHSYDLLLKTVSSTTRSNLSSTFLCYSTLDWLGGTFMMILSLMNCGIRIIHSIIDPEEICKVIEKYQVRSFFLIPPFILTSIVKSKVLRKYKLESLNICTTIGGRNKREILEEFRNSLSHVSLHQAYGMTELGTAVIVQTKNCKGIDSVGFIAPNVEAKVVDPDGGKTLGPNQQGELCVRVPRPMIGYYKNPKATSLIKNEEGWLYTGDKVYYDEKGEFYVVDRLKEVMKFRGHHISPTELEELILDHPAVMEVAVVSAPHELDIERPMAFIKRHPGFEVTEKEIVELTAELGETKKLWGGVKFLDEFPRTSSGKICRKDLREMAKALSTSNT